MRDYDKKDKKKINIITQSHTNTHTHTHTHTPQRKLDEMAYICNRRSFITKWEADTREITWQTMDKLNCSKPVPLPTQNKEGPSERCPDFQHT